MDAHLDVRLRDMRLPGDFADGEFAELEERERLPEGRRKLVERRVQLTTERRVLVLHLHGPRKRKRGSGVPAALDRLVRDLLLEHLPLALAQEVDPVVSGDGVDEPAHLTEVVLQLVAALPEPQERLLQDVAGDGIRRTGGDEVVHQPRRDFLIDLLKLLQPFNPLTL